MSSPNIITTNAEGHVLSMVGPRTTDLLELAALVESLKLEAKGIKLSRHITALKIARAKFNALKMNLAAAIERATKERDAAKADCTYVTENAS